MYMIMDFKKFSIFFLLISASVLLLSTSLAGRPLISVEKLANEVEPIAHIEDDHDEVSIHERVLKVNTKDYGRYDPSPNLVRPPFKLIPN